MKYIILFLYCNFSILLFSQAGAADCALADPQCSDQGQSFDLSIGNGAVNDLPNGNNVSNPGAGHGPAQNGGGCLNSGELNPNWFLINIGSDGFLEFTIGQVGGSGYYDWAMWPYYENPDGTSACNDITGNTLAPVACCWNDSDEGFTGMVQQGNLPPGADPGNFDWSFPVTAGQQFVLCFSNYSNLNGSINLVFGNSISGNNNPNSAGVTCDAVTPDQSICLGEVAMVTVSVPPEVVNPTFQWLNTQGVSNPTGGTDVEVTISQTTSYEIVVFDDGTPFDTVAFTITVFDPPTPDAGADMVICQGNLIDLIGTQSQMNSTISWSHDVSNITPNPVVNYSPNSNVIDPQVSVNQLGTYIFSLSEDNGICPVVSDQLEITVKAPISGNITPYDTICFGENVTIGVFGLSDGIGSSFEILWNTGDVGTGNEMNITSTPQSTSTYSISIPDACRNSPFSLSTEVFVAPIPVVKMSVVEDSICEPAIFELVNDTDPVYIGNYNWTISNGYNAGNQSPYLTDPIYNGSYNVKLVVISPYGCIGSEIKNKFITSNKKPIANFSWTPNPVKMLNTDVSFQNTTQYGDDISWSFESGIPSVSSSNNPKVHFPTGIVDEYKVSLYTVNDLGCYDTITKTLIVHPEVQIFAPNTFTPDGDEFNQYWKVYMEGIDIYAFNLTVFNRWGEVIWESNDVNIGWDGTYNGKKVEKGTYVWKVSTRDALNDGKYSWNGFVNVLR